MLVFAFVVGAVLGILALIATVPLDFLAVPTPLCDVEIAAISAFFLAYVARARPAKDALDGGKSSVSRLMRRKVGLPRPVRAAALALLAFGSFFFAFWAAADVIGGYRGYGYSFSAYGVFPSIYNHSIGLIPYISSRDNGTQAAFYMGLAILGLVLFRLNRGFGAALKDAVTLFLAPCLVVFELALWSQAPEDMTWHVTDFLWIGGIADGGFRQQGLSATALPQLPGGSWRSLRRAPTCRDLTSSATGSSCRLRSSWLLRGCPGSRCPRLW